MSSNKDNIYIDTEKRLFYIQEDIDEATMGKVCFELLKILQEDNKNEKEKKEFVREPIKLYINSSGGYVDDAWALISIMLKSKTPIYTYCTSYAHSAAFLIFIAGEKRFITNDSWMICHQFSNWINGEYQYIKDKVADLDKLWEKFLKYICSRTRITATTLNRIKDCRIDWSIYSEQLLELGVATDVIDEF